MVLGTKKLLNDQREKCLFRPNIYFIDEKKSGSGELGNSKFASKITVTHSIINLLYLFSK